MSRLRNSLATLAIAALAAAPALAETAVPLAPTTLAQGVNFIGTALNVIDLDRAKRFYTEGLGLTVAATLPMGTRSETILQFPGNPSQPSVLLMHDSASSVPRRIDHGNGFSRLVISVVDLAALAARLTQLGYQHGDIRSGGQGYQIMTMTDPEGFRLELVQQRVRANGN